MKSLFSDTRRRLAAALAFLTIPVAGAAIASSARKSGVRSAPTLNVKDFGAFGNGRLPDLSQVRAALQAAAEHPGGATVLFPPGEYFLGAADETYLAVATKLRNVRIVGERATISCRSVNGISSMLVLAGCTNVTIEGFTFQDRGLNREARWRGAVAIRPDAGSEGVDVRDCKFESVLAALMCRDFETGSRCRNIRLTNLEVRRSMYGACFQHNGDDVVVRGLRCNDVMRSYFPYGVSNHDVELEAVNNATGFTDVLISCYRRDTTNIQVKLKSRGKRGGDCIVNLDHQDEVPNKALRNIKIDLDVDDVDCGLYAAISFRALDTKGNAERITNRRWESISIDGDVKICDKTKLFYFESLPKTPGTLRIGPRLARHPRLPSSFPGFDARIDRP